MSGWSSKADVVSVVKASIRSDSAGTGLSRDPKDYNVSGIVRDAFTCNYFGWGMASTLASNPADTFKAALANNLRKRG